MRRRVVIISYGTGNIASVGYALEAVGASCTVASSESDLAGADALVLPGVGHFGRAMHYFRASGLLPLTLKRIRSGTPTMGICLGFQLLTCASEEAPDEQGLGILPCATVRIRPLAPNLHKVPHLGWNHINQSLGSPRLLTGIPPEHQIFYYSNAYGVISNGEIKHPCATYSHGAEYMALSEQDSIFGVQFHPEKSGDQGLHLLKNFLET